MNHILMRVVRMKHLCIKQVLNTDPLRMNAFNLSTWDNSSSLCTSYLTKSFIACHIESLNILEKTYIISLFVSYFSCSLLTHNEKARTGPNYLCSFQLLYVIQYLGDELNISQNCLHSRVLVNLTFIKMVNTEWILSSWTRAIDNEASIQEICK